MSEVIRLGSHPMNFSLFILRRRGVLEPLAAARGWRVEWVDYPDGRASGELIGSGQVDWVGTGSTPPLRAQAAGVALSYVAASPPRRAGSALLVRDDGPYTRIDQLRGRRIAVTLGSYTDPFVVKALQVNALRYSEVEVLDLPGRQGQRALLDGEVEAWAALDPLLSEQVAQGGVRVLGEVGDYMPNRSLFWARREWLEYNLDQARLVYAVLADNDLWVAAHLEEAARLIAAAHGSDVPVQGWVRALGQRPWGILPADAGLVAEQQEQAQLLGEAGLLPVLAEPIRAIDLAENSL